MKSFIKEYAISAPIEKVWGCLTRAELMDKWGAKPSNFEDELGGSFSMWGDYLGGTVTNIQKPHLLIEDWLVDGMDNPSEVEFKLKYTNGSTVATLKHSNIPEELVDELFQGWDDHYLGAIKKYLEN